MPSSVLTCKGSVLSSATEGSIPRSNAGNAYSRRTTRQGTMPGASKVQNPPGPKSAPSRASESVQVANASSRNVRSSSKLKQRSSSAQLGCGEPEERAAVSSARNAAISVDTPCSGSKAAASCGCLASDVGCAGDDPTQCKCDDADDNLNVTQNSRTECSSRCGGCESPGLDETSCSCSGSDCCSSGYDDTDEGSERHAVKSPAEPTRLRTTASRRPASNPRPSTRCLSPVPSLIESSTSLSSVRSFPSQDADPEISLDCLKQDLSAHVAKRYGCVIKACRNFDTKSTGKMAKSQFRQVLRTFCLPLTAAQFRELVRNVPQDEVGKVNYVDFFRHLTTKKPELPEDETVENTGSLSLDEITVKIHDTIKPRLHDVLRSFWLFDHNKDGFVKKTELRKVLQNHCFRLTDKQFKDLWARYETRETGLLRYEDFLAKIGVHYERIKNQLPKLVPAKTYAWEEPCSKLRSKLSNYEDCRRRAILCRKDDPSIHGLSIDDIQSFFLSKLSNCGQLLEKVLYMMDHRNDGQINVDDLHNSLNCFVMPMNLALFKTLLARLQVEVKPISRTVDIREFLNAYCQPKSEKKRLDLKQDLESCETVSQIRNRVVNPAKVIREELSKLGKDVDETITRRELKRMFKKGLKCSLTDEQLKELADYLDPRHTNSICCGKLLLLFQTAKSADDAKIEKCLVPTRSDLGLAPQDLEYKYRNLQGTKLLSKIKYHVNKNKKAVEHAFLACDPDNCRLIQPHQLKMILNNFCFPLTDEQFAFLERNFQYHGNRIDYVEFMKPFEKTFDEDSARWTEIVHKLARYKTERRTDLPVDEVQELLEDAIATKRYRIEKDFKAVDPCKLGYAYKGDSKAILSKYVMRFTDQQFDHIWRNFPVNEYNCLLYEKLLEGYSKQPAAEKPAHVEESPPIPEEVVMEAGSADLKFQPPQDREQEIRKREERLERAAKARRATRVVPRTRRGKPPEGNRDIQEIAFEEFPHLRGTYAAIKGPIRKNLTLLRQKLRELDKKRTGLVDFSSLNRLLAYCGAVLTEEDKYYIQEFFDKDLSGKIRYHDFMRMFAWHA